MAKKFKVDYSPNLSNDFQRAIDLYKELSGSHKIGKKFVGSAKKQLEKLKTNALHFQVKYSNVRCMMINKYPYRVYFRVDEENNSVYVEAIIHTSESPENWPKD